MADFKDFEKGLQKIYDDALISTIRGVTQIGKAVGVELAKATPVDTGRAQKNWEMSATESFNYQDSIEPQAFGNRQSVNYQTVVSKLNQDADRLVPAIKARKLYEVYVGNVTPYLGYLNEGRSSQAPAGFLDSTASRAFRKYANELTSIIFNRRNAKKINAR